MKFSYQGPLSSGFLFVCNIFLSNNSRILDSAFCKGALFVIPIQGQAYSQSHAQSIHRYLNFCAARLIHLTLKLCCLSQLERCNEHHILVSATNQKELQMEASTLIPVAEAATMVGKSRMALMKAIAKGKISASRDVHGRWQIDPAELTRAYKLVATSNSNKTLEMADGSSMIAEVLQVRLEAMEGRCAEQANTIDDLRLQRDQEQGERKQAQAQLMALLSGPKPVAGFWQRLLGGT